MPTWGQILAELQHPDNRTSAGGPDFDKVRRKHLAHLHDLTHRTVILYASAFAEPRQLTPEAVSITLRDQQGFMEAISGTSERELDLILHSPGGSAEAADAIVNYLRTRFAHIRVFVPLAAMSAATMVALGADVIVMGKHSQLGPIDPQFSISTPEGPRSAPAKAILDQFDKAKQECQDPRVLPAWLPILRSYAPGLLAQCEQSRQLAETIVCGWLERYMFKGDPQAAVKAQAASAWFADYNNFSSHGRAVDIASARQQNLHVEPLEQDQELQDAVLSIFHATTHTLNGTPAAKIIENHLGRAFVTMIQTQTLVVAPPSTVPSLPSPPSAPAATDARRAPHLAWEELTPEQRQAFLQHRRDSV
jgi:hypothetical protein